MSITQKMEYKLLLGSNGGQILEMNGNLKEN